MWALIFGVVFVLAVVGFIYLCSRVYGFSFWERVTEKKWLRILIAIALVIVPTLVLWLVLGYMNAAVAVIFLIVFWLIADLVFFVVGKIRRQKFKRKWAAVPALAAAIVYPAHSYSTTVFLLCSLDSPLLLLNSHCSSPVYL